ASAAGRSVKCVPGRLSPSTMNTFWAVAAVDSRSNPTTLRERDGRDMECSGCRGQGKGRRQPEAREPRGGDGTEAGPVGKAGAMRVPRSGRARRPHRCWEIELANRAKRVLRYENEPGARSARIRTSRQSADAVRLRTRPGRALRVSRRAFGPPGC